MAWKEESLSVTTDIDKFDFAAIHQYLSEVAYWSRGIAREKVERAARNSLAFGLFHEAEQIGFARVITDATTFAYLSDVFIFPDWQGLGLGQWLMKCVLAHPDLQGLRRIMLLTADAHGLYEKFGFTSPANPDMVMEIKNLDAFR
ncbi:GNAT family N-acetyltransferase [Paraburkholderia sp. D15]|uniref:GNAT family N-acetyltransferase n=1 Tax=Paraburkholderia sp. D15 TaxID=2880218 RepID=UPI00247907E4|nr:GNAT family N-acetyltransferase [Paraburkholderia sp. D15]WGS54263.1 GNAT family N-acetyltransferase [Paraburkholderia sp. D15]WKF60191.1 hypothetical protein HUO10_004709 [Paraburkholderia busanensis]